MKTSVRVTIAFVLVGAALTLVSCGDTAKLPLSAGIGPQPQLPPPNVTVFPTVNIAKAVGWQANERPIPAPGLAATAFATGLDHPRNVYVLPNGDVLVAESNTPPKPDDSPGLRGFIMRWIMARAGAGVPSPNRLILLRDTTNGGVADIRSIFLEGVHSPFGIALIGDQLWL
jgi:glucose/arabinose dehydrogenase